MNAPYAANPKYAHNPRVAQEKTALDEGWAAAIAFFKGDYNGTAAIFLDTAMGLIPVAGQLIDGRDVVRGVVDVPANRENGHYLEKIPRIHLAPG